MLPRFLISATVLLLYFTGTMASEKSTSVLKANSDFGKNLYQILARQDGNIVFSPLSAHTVLALAYQGAAGNTAASFASTLKLPESKAAASGYQEVMSGLNSIQNVTLHIANKVYIKPTYKLKDSFGQVARDSFYSEVEAVEFAQSAAAAQTINGWVEKKTNNKIKDLIKPDSLNALTRLVLVNAIYFKGDWKHKFDKALTKKEPFYLNDQDKVDVDMMHITKNFRYGENEELDAKILELPYNNEDVSMLIVLPNKKDGIKALEQKLQSVDISELARNIYSREVIVSLPKFKIESTIPLNEVLKEMGLGVIFDPEKADFSGLLESPEQLYVSEVLQKAFIEVNEEGAEAAAATGMQMRMRRSIESVKDEFIVDCPFLFYLVSKYDNDIKLIFFGRVQEPPGGLKHYRIHEEL